MQIGKLITAASFVALAICTGLTAAQQRDIYEVVHELRVAAEIQRPRRNSIREFAIQNQIRQLDRPLPIVVGDSLVEGALLNGAINAGVGGYQAEDVAELLMGLQQQSDIQSRMSCVIVAVGVNDSVSHHSTRRFASGADSIMKMAKGKPVVVTTIPVPASSNVADASLVEEYNDHILSSLRAGEVKVYDLAADIKSSPGHYADKFTEDGLHLSAQGYMHWREAMARATGNCPN